MMIMNNQSNHLKRGKLKLKCIESCSNMTTTIKRKKKRMRARKASLNRFGFCVI
jgi:hypothetical protein